MSLIPPEQILRDYSVTAEQFVEHGNGFVGFLINRCRLERQERVLDLGCGPGFHSRVLADYLSSGSYEGLDIMPPVIEFCQTAYSGYSNVHFTLADIQNSHYNPDGRFKQSEYKLPFRDAEFDLAFAISLFTHLLPGELEYYLAETRRVLKPGGRCVATFFLLNDDSRASEKPAYRFAFDRDNHSLLDVADPAKAVAYDENWVKAEFRKHRLPIREVIYGDWTGTHGLLGTLQDIVVAVSRTA